MEQYKNLIRNIIKNGENSGDRTGTGTTRIFSTKMEFDCSTSFPIVTLKYTHYPAIFHELIWFLSGNTNIEYLQKHNITIWDEWANSDGELGPLYGAQWRNANGTFRGKIQGEWITNGVDQLGNCIELIKHNPQSRRIIVDCWNTRYLPEDNLTPGSNASLGKMALAPCHMMFQFFVRKNGYLDIQMYQRSVDSFLGLPFNISSYALLLMMVAQVTNKLPGKLYWIGGDTHIYNNHNKEVSLMLSRSCKKLPILKLNSDIRSIDDFKYTDILLQDYKYHPAIKGEISV